MKKKPQQPPKNFEATIEELEQILRDLEGDKVGLEESLAKYERGTFLLAHCRGVLGEAEKRIEELTLNAEGKLIARPMAEEAEEESSDEEE